MAGNTVYQSVGAALGFVVKVRSYQGVEAVVSHRIAMVTVVESILVRLRLSIRRVSLDSRTYYQAPAGSEVLSKGLY